MVFKAFDRRCHPGALPVQQRIGGNDREAFRAMEWVVLYTLAANEEDAAGGRVVTVPTNVAAGIIPAVLHYYRKFVDGFTDDGVVRFLLTAGAIKAIRLHAAASPSTSSTCQST